MMTRKQREYTQDRIRGVWEANRPTDGRQLSVNMLLCVVDSLSEILRDDPTDLGVFEMLHQNPTDENVYLAIDIWSREIMTDYNSKLDRLTPRMYIALILACCGYSNDLVAKVEAFEKESGKSITLKF